MSHERIKTTYNTEGAYGSTEKHTLFVHHNHCSDYVTFYDEQGDVILVIPDTIENNLFDAIQRLMYQKLSHDDNNNLINGCERMTEEDRKLCRL